MSQAESRRRQVSAFSNMVMLVIWFTVGKLIGENGITYVAIALGASCFFCALACGGVTEALGRFLRSRKSRGQYKNIQKMKKSAIIFHGVAGLVGGVVLFFLAGVIAENLFQVKYCAIIIRMFAPFVLFRAVSAVLLGYFQGEGLELPLAGIGILRAFFVLLFSALFMGRLGDYGDKVSVLLQQEDFSAMYKGLAIALAVCLAELVCVLVLALLYYLMSRGRKHSKQEGMRTVESWTDCIRYFSVSRSPAILSELLVCAPLLLGVFYWNGMTEILMTDFYGIYIGKFLPLLLAVVALLFVFAIPILDKAFGYLKKEDKRYARMVFQSGLHICVVQGIFFSVFIAVLAEQIAAVVMESNAEIFVDMLRAGSCVIVLGSICIYLSMFLGTMGKKYLVSGVLALVFLVYLIYTVLMINFGKGNGMVPVYGTVACLALVCVFLGIPAYRMLRMRMDWLRMVVIPVGCSCAVGLLCMVMVKVFTPHLGNGFTVLIVFIPAIFLYWVLLLVLRNFKEQELDVIVGGRLIHALGQLLRVY